MILSVFCQLLAGLLWLAALLISANTMIFSVQTISSIRGVYSSLLSVFLVAQMQESPVVKEEKSTSPGRLIINPVYFVCALPTFVVFLLDGHELGRKLLVLTLITLLYILLLVFRDKSGAIKSSKFEVASPILLLAVLGMSLLLGVEILAAVIASSFLVGSRFVMFSLRNFNKIKLFQLVTQFPLYFSPLILIFFRSELYVDISIDGANEAFLEAAGLLINGIGGALAMALIMRKSEKLFLFSLIFGALMLVMLGVINLSITSSGGNALVEVVSFLICIEFARLAVWMIHTDLIKRSSRIFMSISYNIIGAIGVFVVFYAISQSNISPTNVAVNILSCYLIVFFIFMAFWVFGEKNKCPH